MSSFINKVELDDLINTSRIHFNRSIIGLQQLKLFAVITIFFSLTCLFMFWETITEYPYFWMMIAIPLAMGLIIASAITAFTILGTYIYVPIQTRKLWVQTPAYRTHDTLTVEDDLILICSLDGSNFTMKFPDLYKWLEREEYFLIYQNSLQYLSVRKQDMTSDETKYLRAMLVQGGVPLASFRNS